MLLKILLLALGSAMFPALLAGAAVILSRERPARLLLGFWMGGLLTSVGMGMLILTAFGEHAAALDQTSGSLSPGAQLAAGVGAMFIGWLLGSKKGRSVIDSWRKRRSLRHPHDGKPKLAWSERMLGNGSVRVAFVAGAILNLPGPFYLIALGDIGAAHYPTLVDLGLVLLFNVIMLLLVEIPMVGYMFDPERTDRLVSRLAAWLNRNGMRIIAMLAGAWGVSLVVHGLLGVA